MRFIIITLLKTYWRIFKPKTLGVKLLLINDDKVLLVEHSYTKGLFLPGGGVKNNEIFDQAIKREILEELGFKIENHHLLGIYQNKKEGKIDTIVVFYSRDPIDISKAILSNEISHVNFYSLNNLPKNISVGSRKRIEEYMSKNFPMTKEW